jgi:hypothetical protein
MISKVKNLGGFRFSDFFVIVLFLSIAYFSLSLFRKDLLQTISLRNVEPAGTVIIKKNTVQRRHSDRVLWDRLAPESPVYLGDLIRVADVSAATLLIEDNSIELNENTLIRITGSPDGGGVQILLSEGSLSLASGANSRSISLELNGKTVQAGHGTALNASVSPSGEVSVYVSEGSAVFTFDGQSREISSGFSISLDADGVELAKKEAVIFNPAPNARYVNNSRDPLPVGFLWNRVNLEYEERLRLEIASDRNFSRILYVYENLESYVQTALGTGLWYWRLSLGNSMLGEGRLTVADGAGPQLQSPVVSSVFRYRNELPVLNFQWAQTEHASSYILEVSNSPDFTGAARRRQTTTAFYSDKSLGPGTWYWRVQAVFLDIFNGVPSFSPSAFFSIEYSDTDPLAEENISLRELLAMETPSELIPLLPVPANMHPAMGFSFGLRELRSRKNIVFSWQAVQDANAYIFSLYQQTSNGRRLIVRTDPQSGSSYTLNNLSLLDRGTFVWQVEAVNRRGVVIDRRGNIGENIFILDFPPPGPVLVEDTGILYGN